MPAALNHFVYAYNNPLVILSSLAFFTTFAKMKVKQSKIINHIAQSAIAVLLVHGGSSLNWPMKAYFKDVVQYDNPIQIIILWIFGLMGIFTISVLIDQLRIYTYKQIGSKIIDTIDGKINKITKNQYNNGIQNSFIQS